MSLNNKVAKEFHLVALVLEPKSFLFTESEDVTLNKYDWEM